MRADEGDQDGDGTGVRSSPGRGSGLARGPGDLACLVAILAVTHAGGLVVGLAAGAALAVAVASGTLPATVAAAALITIVGVVLATRSVPGPLPGVAVLPDEEPHLTGVIAQTARLSGVHAPLLVRTAPDVEAGLVVMRARGRRVTLVILGVPLVRGLPAVQLAAVVAHELAHRGLALDRRTAALMGARDGMVTALRGWGPRRARVAVTLLRATRRRAWTAELAADRRAAEVMGPDAMCGALTGTSLLGAASEQYGDGAAGRRYETLDAVVAHPLTRARLIAQSLAVEALDPGPASCHPPVPRRVEALGGTPGTGGAAGTGTSGRAVWPQGWPRSGPAAVPAHLPVPLRNPERLVAAAVTMAEEDGPAVAPSPGLAEGPAAAEVRRQHHALAVARLAAATLLAEGWSSPSAHTPELVTDPDGRTVDLADVQWRDPDSRGDAGPGGEVPGRVREVLRQARDGVDGLA